VENLRAMKLGGIMTEKEFFDEIESFYQLRDKQKQRGLNNYNLLTTVLKPSDEVRLHSRMLCSLLDPNGKHFQGSLFLTLFFDVLTLDEFGITANDCIVRKEYENIDLYITDGSKHIIIENKILAGDQKNQIERYLDVINQEYSDAKSEDIVVVYLSLDRKVPSQYSLGDLKINGNYLVDMNRNEVSQFRSIHYKTEIMVWLEQCRHEVQNITNLNYAIEQYMDVVRMINNEYKGKAMTLADYLKGHKELYPMAIAVSKVMPQVRKDIAECFFNDVVEKLQQVLGEEWVVEIQGDLSTRHSFPLRAYKHGWGKSKSLIVGYEFANSDFNDCYLGIVRCNDKIGIKGGIDKHFNVRLSELNVKPRTTSWWLHWEWFNRGDFIEYILKSEDSAKNELITKFQNMAKEFETNSGLLSEINMYLQEHG